MEDLILEIEIEGNEVQMEIQIDTNVTIETTTAPDWVHGSSTFITS